MSDQELLSRRLEIVEAVARAWAKRDPANHVSLEVIRPRSFTDSDSEMYQFRDRWTAVALRASVRCRDGVKFWWSSELTLTTDWISRVSDDEVRDCVRKFVRPPIVAFAEWL